MATSLTVRTSESCLEGKVRLMYERQQFWGIIHCLEPFLRDRSINARLLPFLAEAYWAEGRRQCATDAWKLEFELVPASLSEKTAAERILKEARTAVGSERCSEPGTWLRSRERLQVTVVVAIIGIALLAGAVFSWTTEQEAAPAAYSAPTSVRADSSPKVARRTHKIVRGETLGGIARQYYGSSKYYGIIQAANPGKADDPRKVQAGDVLVIPVNVTLDRMAAHQVAR
jgi:LysM repeat protein